MNIQTLGMWGAIILGVIMTIGTLISHGIAEPIRFAGGGGLILMGVAFWFFKKNAEAVAEAERDAAQHKAQQKFEGDV